MAKPAKSSTNKRFGRIFFVLKTISLDSLPTTLGWNSSKKLCHHNRQRIKSFPQFFLDDWMVRSAIRFTIFKNFLGEYFRELPSGRRNLFWFSVLIQTAFYESRFLNVFLTIEWRKIYHLRWREHEGQVLSRVSIFRSIILASLQTTKGTKIPANDTAQIQKMLICIKQKIRIKLEQNIISLYLFTAE